MPETHKPNEHEVIIIEDETLQQGFTQIPNAILRRPDVTAGAKITYMALLSYAWQKDSCFPGQDTLALDTGVGKRSVVRYLQELQAIGLLEIKRRGLGLTNVYIIKKTLGTSRSAKLALQEMPKKTHPEVPNWHPKEYEEEEDEERITLSNIRRNINSRPIVDETPGSNSASHPVAPSRTEAPEPSQEPLERITKPNSRLLSTVDDNGVTPYRNGVAPHAEQQRR